MTGCAFRTPDGIGVPAVTTDQMREVDRLAVEVFGIDLRQMMENAGRTLAARVRAVASRGDATVTVVAGNGGNGGGGLVCARHLHNRAQSVRVVLDRPPGELDGAAAHQHAILDETGVPVTVDPDAVGETGVVVDALIGYGLTGPVRGPGTELLAAMNATDAPVVSLDVPSGRDATTGDEPGRAVDSARVVTLALPKTGLWGLDCPLALADISLPGALYERLGLDYESPFDDGYWVSIASAESE